VAVTESGKHDVYTYFEEAMGKERATTLMAMVSPTAWADVATKQDLTHEVTLLRTELKGDIAELRAELKGDMAELRMEMKGQRTEMKQFVTKDYLEKALRNQLMATFAFYGIFMSIAVTLARLIP